MEKLFEIVYFAAKLKLPFPVFEINASLEAKDGVKLGQTYRNDKSCKNFITAIADQSSPKELKVRDLPVSWEMVPLM